VESLTVKLTDQGVIAHRQAVTGLKLPVRHATLAAELLAWAELVEEQRPAREAATARQQATLLRILAYQKAKRQKAKLDEAEKA
jgi:hypothetical protein